jgi:hypothetical protein
MMARRLTILAFAGMVGVAVTGRAVTLNPDGNGNYSIRAFDIRNVSPAPPRK